ncbi:MULTISPECIES: hemin uptake protein HemP [unclassified Ectothiorhodospira]|uniref:hemin uptake protein HemP n=1 Tax=unclassified Ectothiorhodospira TaxID=2684909 RepID=UPI001EE7BAA4|nr:MULTISPECIES: hemin uptake protein HemP [unclassified Ectothiorhodospira]MCG5514942.1 hemin uptake protein HemP [Ectothiorhodospira sp. 9100]MCG5517733.1 hemin uptake protein HemP [Ectothiorhodospira sp. 9905]
MNEHKPKYPATPNIDHAQEAPVDVEVHPGHENLLSSRRLLQGRRQLHIEHMGEIYTLRLTSKGKLILTK